MKKITILFFLLLAHISCKDVKTKNEENNYPKTISANNSNKKAQVYTDVQQDLIQKYVYECAHQYNYRFNHHEYQACLDQGIQEDASISYFWQQKAMPYFKARKYEVGMGFLDKAVELNPVRYLSYRGFINCIFAKDYKAAISDFEVIKAIEGNSIEMDHSYNFHIALSNLQLNHFEKAEQLFKQDIQAQVEEWGVKQYHHLDVFYLGIAQYEQKKWNEANNSFDLALKKYPLFSDAMFYKAICLFHLQDDEAYSEWYAKAKLNGEAGNTISEDNSLYEPYPYQVLWF